MQFLGGDSGLSQGNDIAIGIDLGTSNSCVAVFRQGQVEIIANEQGNRTTPSYVAFTPTGTIVGEAAKSQAARNTRNTICNAKRFIGAKFSDSNLQEDIKRYPFQVLDVEGNPVFNVLNNNEAMKFTPEEISSLILMKLKETAEAYLGFSVTKATITVPANFTDGHRSATQKAANLAGLNVLRLINEPTSAAMAFGQDKYRDRNIGQAQAPDGAGSGQKVRPGLAQLSSATNSNSKLCSASAQKEVRFPRWAGFGVGKKWNFPTCFGLGLKKNLVLAALHLKIDLMYIGLI